MSDVVTGAIIGAAAVVVGTVATGALDLVARRQDRRAEAGARRVEREAAERTVWLERSAATLGRVLEFATDVHPTNSTALIQDAAQAKSKFENLEAKWEALREPLGVLIVGLPTAAERDLAEDVLERLRKIYNGLSWVLSDIARSGHASAGTILDLTEDWGLANAKLRELRDAVHGVMPS